MKIFDSQENEGHCPNCQSAMINWRESELSDGFLGSIMLYKGDCEDCGCSVEEVYNLIYSHSNGVLDDEE